MSFNAHKLVNRESKLWQTLHAWPKIELHRHLEGSIRLETLIDVAQANDIPLPAYTLEQLRPYVQMMDDDEPNFAVFLSKFEVLRQFYRTLEIIQRITREVIEDAALDNVRYMELRFTPAALVRHNGFSYADVIACVAETAAAAQNDFGLLVKLIVSVNRHEPVEMAADVLDSVLALQHPDIVALDLAGLEVNHAAAPFEPVFHKAQGAGLHITIHAGEWAGPENVREAIEIMGAERIGHGVRAVEDSDVMQLVRDKRVTLEVCPTSNLQSGVATEVREHPLVDLAFLKLPTTINTDDPSISNIVLTDELMLAHRGMRLSLNALKRSIMQAAQASFLEPGPRNALVMEFRNAFGMDDTLIHRP